MCDGVCTKKIGGVAFKKFGLGIRNGGRVVFTIKDVCTLDLFFVSLLCF